MKKRLSLLCVLVLVGLAVGCDSNQAGSESADDEPARAVEQAQAGEDDEQAVDEQDDDEGQEGSQTDIPEDQSMEGTSEGGNFFVTITPEPNPIPFQELFDLEVKVFAGDEDQNPAADIELDQLRATMPAHGHGMKTEPTITERDEGTYLVEGMRFHMQGEGDDGRWVIEAVLNKNGTIDQAKFDVQCCRQ